MQVNIEIYIDDNVSISADKVEYGTSLRIVGDSSDIVFRGTKEELLAMLDYMIISVKNSS